MIRHQTRNESVEMFVVIVAAVAIMVGLQLDVISPVHLAFITGNYTMYFVWCVAVTWRERARQSQKI